MENSLPELNREQVLSMNIEDKTGRYPDGLGYFSLIYRTLVFRGFGFYVFIALILMPVLFLGSGPILVRIACTTVGSMFIAAYCLRVFLLCLNLREYRRLTGWVKEISDERVHELDQRILRLTGSRHFEMSDWVDVVFQVTLNNLLFFFFHFVVCGSVLLYILMGNFASSPRLVVALVLSSLGFMLWWVRVIRAGLAWRELRTTIY